MTCYRLSMRAICAPESSDFCYKTPMGTMMELVIWFGELFQLGQPHIYIFFAKKVSRLGASYTRWQRPNVDISAAKKGQISDYMQTDSTNPMFRAIIVQRILYSFLSIYLDRAEQGVVTYIPWAVRLGTIEQLYLASRQAGK